MLRLENWISNKVVEHIKKDIRYKLKEIDLNTNSGIFKPKSRDIGIYVHVPFCRHICPFCPYYRVIYDRVFVEKWVYGILREIELLSRFFDNVVIEWIYFGGGTPSLLDVDHLKIIVNSLREHFKVNGGIGIEANPLDLNLDKVSKLIELDIDRISIGVQSFSNKYLHILNREEAGKSDQVVEIIKNIVKNFDIHINIDLMFALPGQILQDFVQDIEKAIELEVHQITIYPLILTNHSKFSYMIRNRLLPSVPSINEELRMLRTAKEILESHGYKLCTIWSWTRSHRVYETVSNEMEGDYIGLGPSAISITNNFEHINIPSINLWYRKLSSKNKVLKYIRRVSQNEFLWRAFANQLYTARIDPNYLIEKYGSVEQINKVLKLVKILRFLGYIDHNYTLTWKGHRFSHIITKKFVEEIPCEVVFQAMTQRAEIVLKSC